MRLYTKYTRLRSSKKPGGWFHWALAGIALSFLVWLWWQQRIQPPAKSGTLARSTNETLKEVSSRDISLSQRINRLLPTTAITNAPPAQDETDATNRAVRADIPSVTNLPPATLPKPTSAPIASIVATNLLPRATNRVRWPENTFEVQLALARRGLSSGSLDGVLGSQTRAALRAFQEREHLPITGEPDRATKAALSLQEPLLTVYTITSNDLARLTPIGSTWLAKSQQERLDYETLLELVAEKGHAHPGFIRSLNRGVDWTNVLADTPIVIPNTQYSASRRKAAFLRIRLGEKTLLAFDGSTNVLAHFPCSIAQRVEKRPVGELHVAVIVEDPDYTFNPEVFPESPEARQLKTKLVIKPGPNNPVGVAWIGLDRPGYGIHGTPHPEDVGRTESHGCFRLANWNAEYLLQLVSIGTPVLVEP